MGVYNLCYAFAFALDTIHSGLIALALLYSFLLSILSLLFSESVYIWVAILTIAFSSRCQLSHDQNALNGLLISLSTSWRKIPFQVLISSHFLLVLELSKGPNRSVISPHSPGCAENHLKTSFSPFKTPFLPTHHRFVTRFPVRSLYMTRSEGCMQVPHTDHEFGMFCLKRVII